VHTAKDQIYKVAAFNNEAAKAIEAFLKVHFGAMSKFYTAFKSNIHKPIGSLAEPSRTPSSTITPVSLDNIDEAKGTSSKKKKPQAQLTDSRQSITSERSELDEEEDDLNFLDNVVESTMSKIRQAKQIVNLGSSSPTYSVASDSRFKPATAKKYQAVDFEELEDDTLVRKQATKSKYAQVAEETPKFSKYAPQQSSGVKQQPAFKFKLQRGLRPPPALQEYQDFWVKMFPQNPPRPFVQDQYDL
jgi:hypothetical protein